MILSNTQIQKALDEKRLVIDPEPSPRRPEVGSNEKCPYNGHTVDLKLDQTIRVLERGLFTIDLNQEGKVSDLIRRNSKAYVLTDEQPYLLKPRTFILGQTYEEINLPINNDRVNLAARIEGKSSRARCGLLVHFTAPTVHPGFSGHLTLEMINLSPSTFLLKPGMYIAQLIIEEVVGEVFENPSEFQGQNSPGG